MDPHGPTTLKDCSLFSDGKIRGTFKHFEVEMHTLHSVFYGEKHAFQFFVSCYHEG